MGVKTGIYYFPWYNEQRWKEAPFKYTPLLGPYDSSDPAIIAWQLDLIRYCGIDYVIFELVPEGDWAFATVERGIDGAIAYLRRNAIEWSFLLDTKNCPSNTVMEQRSEIAGIERMYRYVLKREWTDGLVRGPSGKPLLFVFAPVPEDALIIGEEFPADIEFRMPIFLPDRQWDTFAEVTEVVPPRYRGQLRLRLGEGHGERMPLVDLLVALGYVSFWDASESSESVRNCAGFSSIIPGYDDSLLKRVPQLAPIVSRREGATLRRQFTAAARNRPEHITIYGWNEYFEGASIEPSKQFGMDYVELLRSLIGDLRAAQDGEARNDKTMAKPSDKDAVVSDRFELTRRTPKRMNYFNSTAYDRLWAELVAQQPTTAHEYFTYHQRRYEELFTALAFYMADRPSPAVAEVGVSGFVSLYKLLFPELRLTTIDRPVEQNGFDAGYCAGVSGAERHYNFDLNEVVLAPDLGTPPLGTFDYVICTEVIEHLLVQPAEFIASLLELSRPDGYLYLTTPNFLSYHRIGALVNGYHPTPVYPKRGHNQDRGHHYREYTMRELVMYVREAGGHIVSAQFSDCWDEDHLQPLLSRCPELRSNLVLVAAKQPFSGLQQGEVVTTRAMKSLLRPFLLEQFRRKSTEVIGRLRSTFR